MRIVLTWLPILLLISCRSHNPEDYIQKQPPLVLMPKPYAAKPEPFSKQGWNKAYARRNFRLGMTFTDFLATPFPDDQERLDIKIPADRVYLACYGDGQKLGADYLDLISAYDDMAPGVFKCVHYAGTGYMRRSARLLMGKNWSMPTAFYFIQPGATGDYYLYKIRSEHEAYAFSGIRKALTEGLRQQPVRKEAFIPMEAGYPFVRWTATWDNGVSRILLENDSDEKDSELTYTLKTLNTIAERRNKESNAINPRAI
jgi:hypothetical protein